MKVELFKPKNKALQEYIECFYLLTHPKDTTPTSYVSFPNTFSMVSILINVENIVTDNEIYTKSSFQHPFHAILYDTFRKPVKVTYEGEIKEITIYFKPLGLNTFLEKDLNFYTKNPFIPFYDFEKKMTSILHLEEKEVLFDEMEKYWISKFCGFQHPFLPQVINHITDKINTPISKIAEELNISHKTLLKHFRKYCSKTPSEFRKIVRFRNALNEKIHHKGAKNLTEISHAFKYFDQAHLNNDFKELTGLSPRDLLNNLNSTDSDELHWIFS
ncbi:helix-turn-helix domain-containing protein [Flavobacteriaceae bacterium R38]|nr:helix-turn-helix domain-containing protein [Flavobacteriaceae bacterium R38]